MGGKEPIVGASLDCWVSDPWEFGTECGCGPFRGRVIDVSEHRLLIRLDQPIHYRGHRLSCVIAQARHVGESPADVDSTETMPANLTLPTRDVTSLADTVARAEEVGAIGGIQRA